MPDHPIPATSPALATPPASSATPPQLSVWLTGQQCSRDQRRDRYTRASMAHPGKMLPSIARYAIATYTRPGDLVLDPMAGIGTTLVEAVHAGRDAIGVEYEQHWVDLALDNLRLAASQGATGHASLWRADARKLGMLLPEEIRGQVALVLTSPPYGSSTHGHVRTPGPRRGKVRKLDHCYSHDPRNLAHAETDELLTGFTQILTGCATLLRPDGHVVITARPYRRHRELIDIPGMVAAAGHAAGLDLVDRCSALIAGVRRRHLVPRASFFQLRNLRAAIAAGDPQWLTVFEDALVFTPAPPPPPMVEPTRPTPTEGSSR